MPEPWEEAAEQFRLARQKIGRPVTSGLRVIRQADLVYQIQERGEEGDVFVDYVTFTHLDLADYKASLASAINAEANRRAQTQGFTHDGKAFSSSPTAQTKWTGLAGAVANGMGPGIWPLTLRTLDEAETYIIPDDATFLAMYGALLASLAAANTAGDVAIGEVNAAPSHALARDAAESYLNG